MSNTKEGSANFNDYLKSWPLYLVPHHLVSRLILKLTRIKLFKNQVIRWFIRKYQVDLSHSIIQDINTFENFNSFFTRELLPYARPIADQNYQIACPADGRISAIGTIEKGHIFQAKGKTYTLLDLLGGNQDFAARYRDGHFATIYLSPRDYHRVHMPFTGKLIRQTLVPGRLFSVGPHTVRTIPRLFARNERVIAHFDTSIGGLAVIMVGAINVGAIETVWSGLVTPPAANEIVSVDYVDTDSITLAKGAEMGRFNMGSTVILLFENPVTWLANLDAGTSVNMGEEVARYI